MTPELEKEVVVGILSALFTALFTGIPAALLFWWTWRRDQERLMVQKLFLSAETLTGERVLAKDSLGPEFGILVRNLSLFPVHVSAAGFEIDGQVLELERPLYEVKMKKNSDPGSPYANVADESSDPTEIPSLKSKQILINAVDRPRLAGALLAAANRRNVSVEELLGSSRVSALVVLETRRKFSSLSFSRRVWRHVRHPWGM